jgi:hypothetical protein
MAYVPGYTGDLFISYSHRDDSDGWVTDVKSKIATRLISDLAGEPEIWFDADRLTNGDIFKQDIHDKLRNTLILVAIISPNFLKSEFCNLEELNPFLDEFGREVIQLQKVRLSDGDTPPLPDAIHEVLFDQSNDTPFAGAELDRRLNKVISTIRRKMEQARQSCRKVYVAQAEAGLLRSASKELGRALHKSSFAVLPTEIVSTRTMESKIQKWIEEAGISIQLRTNPIDRVAEIQLRVAEQTGTPMLVYDRPPRPGDIPGIVEEINARVSQTQRRGQVYFIYDYHTDHEHAHALSSEIESHTGRKVVLPQPGETYHQAKLKESDGFVLFRGAAPEPWFYAHREKLKQAAALRSGRVVPEAYYLARVGSPQDLTCRQLGPAQWEINRVGMPQIADLRPFLTALAGSAAAAGGRT